MFKILHVGDVHCIESEFNDCASLINFILETAKQTQPDLILFEGDQHHTHAVLRLEVMGFWKAAFRAFKDAGYPVAALVGNHDMTGVDGHTAHAMLAYAGDVRVIDRPTLVKGVLMMPYMADRQAFVDACVKFPGTKTVVCHQTFLGSTYENGIYAKDGIDPNLIPQETIISGHIHTPQSFGKVMYTGSPRWRILTDANVERAIWLMQYNDEGKLVNQTAYSTGEVCSRLWHLVDSPEAPVAFKSNAKDRWRIDVAGPLDYVQRRMQELQGPGIKLRPLPLQTSNMLQVRESEGVESAFSKFRAKFQPKYSTPMAVLEEMAKERLSWT